MFDNIDIFVRIKFIWINKLLGKGGCALVWLGKNPEGQVVAMKQFPKAKGALDSSARVECHVFKHMFP